MVRFSIFHIPHTQVEIAYKQRCESVLQQSLKEDEIRTKLRILKVPSTSAFIPNSFLFLLSSFFSQFKIQCAMFWWSRVLWVCGYAHIHICYDSGVLWYLVLGGREEAVWLELVPCSESRCIQMALWVWHHPKHLRTFSHGGTNICNSILFPIARISLSIPYV